MKGPRAAVVVLLGAALMLSSACGGRGAAAARFVEQVGVIAGREPVLPQTRATAERVLTTVGQRADDERALGNALRLACKANPYVPPYSKLGLLVINTSEEDQDVKERAKEIHDQISLDQKAATLLCRLRR